MADDVSRMLLEMVKEALMVIELMIGRGYRPDTVTFNALIDGLCMQGLMDKSATYIRCYCCQRL